MDVVCVNPKVEDQIGTDCRGFGTLPFDVSYVEDDSYYEGYDYDSSEIIISNFGRKDCTNEKENFACNGVFQIKDPYSCVTNFSCTTDPKLTELNWCRKDFGMDSPFHLWIDGIVITNRVVDLPTCSTVCLSVLDADGPASVNCTVTQKEDVCEGWYDVREVSNCVVERNGSCS